MLFIIILLISFLSLFNAYKINDIKYCPINLRNCTDLQEIFSINCDLKFLLEKVYESVYRPVSINKNDLKKYMSITKGCESIKLKVYNVIIYLNLNDSFNSSHKNFSFLSYFLIITSFILNFNPIRI